MRAIASLFVFTIALSLSAPAARASEGEKLLVDVPKGYQAGVERKAPIGTIRKMVPIGETMDDWAEIVAIQTYSGKGDIAPSGYRSGVERFFKEYCPGGVSSRVKDGVENGYWALTWLMQCARNSTTGKPEFIWTKVIQGRDNLYVVQATYRFEPSAALKEELLRYLDSARVCDGRLPDRPC